MRKAAIALTSLALGCALEAPSVEPDYVRAVFDPDAGEIPRPTDILRDATIPQLQIPAEPTDLQEKSAAEIAFVHALNRRDAWPPEMDAEVKFTAPLDERSVTQENLRVFEIAPEGIKTVDVHVDGDTEFRPEKLLAHPTAGRWTRGRSYFAVALGGERGLRGAEGEEVVADAAFYFLRLEEPLTDHVDALPGDTVEEREEAAEKLEEIRVELAPYFEHLESLGIPREDVVSLWSFTVSARTAIVMDSDEGKMPLPSDFLRDPGSGLIDIPIHDDDSEMFKNIKTDLRTLDGFALSANLTFELTDPIDPNTLTPQTVRLYAVPEDGDVEQIEVELRTRTRDQSITIELPGKPLEPATRHVVVVTTGLLDTEGQPLVPMLPGTLAMLDAPVFVDGRSDLGTLDGETAARVEFVRSRTAGALDRLALDRTEVAAAWSFKTMSVYEKMRQARDAAATAETPVDPMDIEEVSPIQAALDFPLSSLTLLRVAKVVHGTIITPDFMDPVSRSRREDRRFDLKKIHFTMSIPRGHDESEPLPVAIFGHGLMTERRFVLAIADALAGEGMAVISVDMPYHGLRSHCAWSGPQCFVNPRDQGGDMICPNPCERGTECSPDGRCVDSNGEGNALDDWPIVGFPQASGAAFVDVSSMNGTRDHFHQSVTDLSALLRSLREGNWREAIGYDIDPDIRYVGQSLGGINGALFTAVHPDIQRSVLNVPGSDLIDLFRESTVFQSHLDALLVREEIEYGSDEHEQVLNIGRWITDPVDPHTFAPFLLNRSFETMGPLPPRQVLIQMATLDLIIPNVTTERLAELSGVPKKDYIGEHGFLVIPVEPAYIVGVRDIARLLGRGEMP
ncbi:MAG: hypothetical protein RIT81_04485 [Deltaproteobacteria bacterium]